MGAPVCEMAQSAASRTSDAENQDFLGHAGRSVTAFELLAGWRIRVGRRQPCCTKSVLRTDARRIEQSNGGF